MTNEEAIEVLKSKIGDDTSYKWTETVRKAIRALETVEQLETRKQELEKKLQSSFSLTDAMEHYTLTKLL